MIDGGLLVVAMLQRCMSFKQEDYMMVYERCSMSNEEINSDFLVRSRDVAFFIVPPAGGVH